MPSAIIIGAGVGGLALAARLQSAGIDVTVVEKNDNCGGRCSVLRRNGWRFDRGPSFYLMPEVFAQTFAELDETVGSWYNLQKCPNSYKVHFQDQTTFQLSTDLTRMAAELQIYEGDSGIHRYLDFLREAHSHYRLSVDFVLTRSFPTLLSMLRLSYLPLLFKLHLFDTVYSRASRYFTSRKMRMAHTFQTMYLGMSPFEAPATYNLLQYAELVQGIYYPIGGFYKIPESFEAIAKKHGAKVIYEAPVARILISGNKAIGVHLESGEEIYADITICNADAVWAYNHLLPPTTFAKNLEKKKLTSSSISFYWCVDRIIKELDVHNIFLADRYRESFDEIFKDHDLPEDLSFYVNVPSRIDPSAAPKGKDAIVVLVPVGYITDQDWDYLVARARKEVLLRLALHLGYDIEPFIVDEDVSDPTRWRDDFNLHAGSILGLSHEISQVLFFRPNTKSRQFKDLYFVGASVQPGTGVPIVISGAKIVSEEILRNLKMPIPWKIEENSSMVFASIFAIVATLWNWILNLFSSKTNPKKL